MCYFGVDQTVASHAYNFALILYLAIGFNMQFDCYRQYLNSTNQSRVVQFTSMASLVLHLVWLHLLTSVWKLGYIGVALAMLLTSIVNFSSVASYLWYYEGLKPFSFSWGRAMKAKHV